MATRRWALIPLLLLVLVLVAVALRWAAITERDLHVDEALYARMGGHILDGNVLLRDVWINKPPLYFHAAALSYALLGYRQLAAYLPNLLASVLSILVVYAILARLRGPRAGLLGALVLCLCPLDVAFAVTAFVDPLTGLWLMLAVLAILAERRVLAGLCFGLAMATKQVALLFAPLMLGLLAAGALQGGAAPRRVLGAVQRATADWLLGCMFVILPLIYWSATIQHPAMGSFGLSGRDEALQVDASGFTSRLLGWLRLLRLVYFESAAATWVWIGGFPLLVLAEAASLVRGSEPRARVLQRLALHLYVPAYLVAMSIGRLPQWDRYLVVLTPLAVISVAVGLDRLCAGASALALRLGVSTRRAELLPPLLAAAATLLLAAGATIESLRDGERRHDLGSGGYYAPPEVARARDLIVQHRARHAAVPGQAVVSYERQSRVWTWEYVLFHTGLRGRAVELGDESARAAFAAELASAQEDQYVAVTPGLERLFPPGMAHERVGRTAGLEIDFVPRR